MRLWPHCENWKERKLCAGRKKSHHLLKLGGVEFSSNQRLSQVLPALLQNEIEEDELGILKCEQHNGAKFVFNSIRILKFQNKSSIHHRNKQVKLEGNCEVSLDTQVNWAGLAVRRGTKSPCQ